jgi:hypothetical protein
VTRRRQRCRDARELRAEAGLPRAGLANHQDEGAGSTGGDLADQLQNRAIWAARATNGSPDMRPPNLPTCMREAPSRSFSLAARAARGQECPDGTRNVSRPLS